MDKYWFKAYKYGYGWYPATWQGWVVLLIYALDIYFGISFFGRHIEGKLETLIIYSPIFILTTVLMLIVIFKTGEKPRWKWGKNAQF